MLNTCENNNKYVGACLTFFVTNNKGRQVIQTLVCENKRIKVLY